MSPVLSALQSLTVLSPILVVGYLLWLGVYRLYLHPLSKFPGPKLAALTKWYEFYYDGVVGGRFTFHLQDLHKKYGPIIRINPDEIHINDPDFYDAFYTENGKLDKFDWMAGYFGNDTSIFTTTYHDLHKARRAPISPLFSRKRILEQQPLIREKSKKLLSKIAQYQQNGRPFAINDAFNALSEDVVFELCFGECYNVLDNPDFAGNLFHSFRILSQSGHVAAHLPWIANTMMRLPESWLAMLGPAYAEVVRLKKDLRKWARDALLAHDEPAKATKHTTVMQAVLDSQLPPQEKSLKRLQEEAHVVVGAAITTTGWAASVAAFHIINTPSIYARLRKELEEAMPDPTEDLDWTKLERLPYLTACIKEGIRVSVGESNRSPRLSSEVITYQEWQIPPRTPISLTIAHVSYNESVFPEPARYDPDRWLQGGKELDKYLVAFGKGTRSCVGMQLGWAELYYMIGGIFRLFNFELYETDISDVEFKYDFAIPLPKLDSKGVRVKVKADE